MTINEMLKKQQKRVSFHMPGHKMRMLDGSQWDVTEVDATDDLHHPQGPYLALGKNMAKNCGSAISFPLVGGSTRGVQMMILTAVRRGGKLILPRNAHLSAWSACALGDIRVITVEPKVDEASLIAKMDMDDVIRALRENPDADAVLLTRPDYYGRIDDISDVVQCAHELGIKVLVDEAHGAHFPYTKDLTSAGELKADFWTQSLHKTLPALTPCAVMHASDASCEDKVRRLHHMLETSSPSSLLLHTAEACTQYMEKNGRQAIEALRKMCVEFRKKLENDERFRLTGSFYTQNTADETRLVIDVRGTGMSGFAVSERLAELNIDMEMADAYRIVGIPSVMTTQEDFDALYQALMTLPIGKEAFCMKSPAMRYGTRSCRVREAALGEVRMKPLTQAAGSICADSIGIYPPGVPLCVAGETVAQDVIDAMLAAQKMGGTLFGVNEGGKIAVAERKYDCVIFDMDGTIMDTSAGVIRSVQYALRQMGLPDDDMDRIRRFIGPPLYEAFSEYYSMNDQDATEAVRQYRVRYADIGVLEYTPYEGMIELIRDISKAGMKIGIATGKPEKFTRIILEHSGLTEYVDMLITPNLSDKKQDKPEMVRAIMEALGKNAVMIGDRCFDMEGAAANGIDSIGVMQGFGTREELEQSGATFVVQGAEAIRAILGL